MTSDVQTITEKRAVLFELWCQQDLADAPAPHQQTAPPVSITTDPKELTIIQDIINKFSNPDSDRIVFERLL